MKPPRTLSACLLFRKSLCVPALALYFYSGAVIRHDGRDHGNGEEGVRYHSQISALPGGAAVALCRRQVSKTRRSTLDPLLVTRNDVESIVPAWQFELLCDIGQEGEHVLVEVKHIRLRP